MSTQKISYDACTLQSYGIEATMWTEHNAKAKGSDTGLEYEYSWKESQKNDDDNSNNNKKKEEEKKKRYRVYDVLCGKRALQYIHTVHTTMRANRAF